MTYPSSIVQRGISVFSDRKVDLIRESERKDGVFLAKVKSSDDMTEYANRLDVTDTHDNYCDCPYFKANAFCKHNIALALELVNEGRVEIDDVEWMWEVSGFIAFRIQRALTIVGNDFRRRISSRYLERKNLANDIGFLATFDDFFEQAIKVEVLTLMDDIEIAEEPLEIEFIIKKSAYEDNYLNELYLNLTLKIGLKSSNKKYFVKNLDRFFDLFENSGILEISEKTSLKVARELFDEQTQIILELLEKELILNLYRKSINHLDLSSKHDKILSLSKGNAANILLEIQKKQDLRIELVSNRYDYRYKVDPINNLKLSDDFAHPVEFYLVPDGDGNIFNIEMEEFQGFEWAYYQWLIKNDTVYQFKDTNQEILEIVRHIFYELPNNTQAIRQENLPHFIETTLPLLEKAGRVHLPNDDDQTFIREALEAEVYFGAENGQITANFVAKYGDFSFPTSNQILPKNVYMIRDTINEKRVCSTLEHIGFSEMVKKDGALTAYRPIPQGESLYHFFKTELSEIRSIATVTLSDGLAKLFVSAESYKPQIKVEENGSWLDVSFDINGISEAEVISVLRSILANEKYHEFKDGRILSLETDEFYETSKALTVIRSEINQKITSKTIQLSRNKGLMLANELNERGTVNTEFSEAFKEMIHDLANPSEFQIIVPEMREVVMRDYQIEGLKWLAMLQKYKFGGVLADEMGLGKTLQAISFICHQKIENLDLLTLVVVPASLTYNWKKELEKFAPDLKIAILVGTVSEREKKFKTAQTQDILITSYATLRQDEKYYKKLSIDMMFLDEAQYIKNSQTQTTKVLKNLKVSTKFALTGTPVENSIDELWSIFQMVLPGLFPTKPKFKKMDRELIAKTIQPFILRREKEQVLKELPDKIENLSYSEFDIEQKKVYLAYLKRMQDDVAKMTDAELKKNKITILSMLTKLRQICDDPRLIIDEYQGTSAKLEQLKEMLVNAKENGRRVLVFSQFTSMLEIIQTEINELGLETYYLHGGTKARERLEMVDKFNDGLKDVFLISLKAGGTGLNLTGADTVILYDLWWNPAVEEQATSRAHRLGQKKVVEIYRLIAEGTIEEKIYGLQQSKRDLFDALVKNTNQTSALSEDDIRQILSIGDEGKN